MSASEITYATTIALEDVAAERLRQHEKFGDQSHLGRFFMLAVLMEEVGEVAQAVVNHESDQMVNDCTEGHGCDACARSRDRIRAELVQVAAVAVQMIEHIDRDAQS